MKTCLILIALLLASTQVDAACTTVAAELAKICCGVTAGITVGANVATCGTNVDGTNVAAVTCKVGTQFVDTTPTAGSPTTALKSCESCLKGFSAAAGTTTTCTVCDQGKASTADATDCIAVTNSSPAANLANCRVFGQAGATTCVVAKDGFMVTANLPVPCPVGQWSALGSSCVAVTAAPTTGHLRNCRSFGEATSTSCQAAKDGFYLVGTTVTPCPAGQFSLDGGACTAVTTVPTSGALLNCMSFEQAAATSCAYGKPGFSPNTAQSGLLTCVTSCIACGTTDPPTAASCIEAKTGYYIQTTTAVPAVTTLEKCQADDLCAACTYNAAAVAPALVVTCTAANAGAYIDTGVAKKCADGNGAPANNAGAAASCLACTATKNCQACSTVDICTSCKAGYVYAAAPVAPATECTIFDVAQKHATCKTASAEGNAGCNECDATVAFRMMDTEIVAPATTATPQAVGECKCMMGYAAKGTEVNCVKCPDGVASCTVDANGKFTALTCTTTGHFISGEKCFAKDATNVVGQFFDTATSKFTGCNAKCSQCTGASATSCTECPAAGTDWKAAPTAGDAALSQYLKARWFINNTCYDTCPTDWQADDAQTACVAGSASGSSTILTIVFGLLLAILF